jgi:prepilin signal peptidase PulO-like enzyme (type II secretory pathway)
VIGGLTLAILLGGLAGLLALAPMLIRRHYHAETFLPYGPFLAAAVFYFLFLFPARIM